MAHDPAVATSRSPKPAGLDWMESISGQIQHLSTGDRAALRRMVLTRSPGADGIAVKLLVGAKVPEQCYLKDWHRWRLIAHFAALLSGTGALSAHDKTVAPGGALFDAGVSEKRLLRLLASRDEGLGEQLALAIRILARTRKPINLWTIYDLLGDRSVNAEDARIQIAQQFFAAQAKSN